MSNQHAFPHQLDEGSPRNGMTLRDYFAGQALAGMMANPDIVQAAISYANGCGYEFSASGTIAKRAYIQADAMIEEGRK